jgi:hypothetical protein
VPWPESVHDLGIVLGALIGVVNDQADGRAGGPTLEQARQNLYLVGLAPLGGMPGFTRFTPIQIMLQVGVGERQARRAAVDDTADSWAVTFSKARNRKEFSETVS